MKMGTGDTRRTRPNGRATLSLENAKKIGLAFQTSVKGLFPKGRDWRLGFAV